MSSNDVKITEDFRGNMTLESSRVITNLRPSEVSALRAHFAAERMPEDVQKLVDEARSLTPPGRVAFTSHERMVHRLADALVAAQRPPVSPEARDELIEEVAEALADDWDPSRDPVLSAMFRDYAATAIDAIARFSFPSQPVYDEEKIARWLAYVASDWTHNDCGDDDHPFGHTNWQAWLDEAAAFIAALRGGELTREETNE